MEQIIVDIDGDGNTTVTAKGVKGSGCAALTKAIESALGKTTKDVKTAEWNQAASAMKVVAGQ